MASVVITQNEILDALAAAYPTRGPKEALTLSELESATEIPIRRLRAALQQLNRQGRLGVHKVRRPALDGRMAVVPGYTILSAPRAKRR